MDYDTIEYVRVTLHPNLVSITLQDEKTLTLEILNDVGGVDKLDLVMDDKKYYIQFGPKIRSCKYGSLVDLLKDFKSVDGMPIDIESWEIEQC
jgi:hypothetical protein